MRRGREELVHSISQYELGLAATMSSVHSLGRDHTLKCHSTFDSAIGDLVSGLCPGKGCFRGTRPETRQAPMSSSSLSLS